MVAEEGVHRKAESKPDDDFGRGDGEREDDAGAAIRRRRWIYRGWEDVRVHAAETSGGDERGEAGGG